MDHELLECVKKFTRTSTFGHETIDWETVKDQMNKKTGMNLSKESYRSRYRRLIGTHSLKTLNKIVEGNDPQSLIRKKLKDPKTLNDLVKSTGLSDIEVLGHIAKLRNEGEEILDAKGPGNEVVYVLSQNTNTTFEEHRHYHDVSKQIRIGIVSDTHICSRFWQPTYLRMAYEHMKSLEITSVYHCGDITDGFYKDRMEETYAFGADAQVDEVVLKYPKVEGMTTYFITGNHDYTHMRNGGSDVGRAIANLREDMIYLGRDYAKIWLTDKVDMDIVHPGDGTSYALSYQLQKRINNMSGGRKPKIMVSGHYHKNFAMFYRNIHALTAASFQAQSNWMRGKAIESDIGFVVLDINVNDKGDIIEFNHRYFPYYVPIVDDYKN